MTSLIRSACCAVCVLAFQPLALSTNEDIVPPASPKQEYWAQFDRKDWSGAVLTAQALVTAARQNAQQEPIALAEALSLLGNAQLRNSDYAGAEAAFKEALKHVEQHEGSASRHTLTPLRGLGFTLAAAGRHEEAVPYLDRALLMQHRTHGLFHLDQQPILRQLANSLTHTGQPLVAERHVNFMLQVGERAYGEYDLKVVPLMCQVGDWHAEVGNFDIARRHYRDAIRLVEGNAGKKHVAIVLPLRRLASSYMQELDFRAKGFIDPYTAQEGDSVPHMPRKENPRYLDTDGQRALLRALDVLKSSPDGSQELLMETLIEAGDWYQFRQDTEKALSFYGKAARIHSELKALSASAQDPLAFPVRVYFPVPGVIARGNRLLPGQGENVFVELEFTVTPEGVVEAPKITDSNTYPRHTTEILNAMREARFRPKFVDGEPVATSAMTFREVYRVRKRPERSTDDDEDPT
jgi:tetratricopeptide (TPR) repeat protein